MKLVEAMADINLIDSSYAGGSAGMEVTWKVMRETAKMMKPGGLV